MIERVLDRQYVELHMQVNHNLQIQLESIINKNQYLSHIEITCLRQIVIVESHIVREFVKKINFLTLLSQ